MKKTIATRFLACFLSCVMLLLALAACGSGDEAVQTSVTQGDNSNTIGENNQSTTTTEKLYQDDLPQELNMNGRVFRIVSRGLQDCKDEVSVDSLNGEVINDAIYTRNLNVADRLNCKIENCPQAMDTNLEVMTAVEKQVLSGSKEFDMFVSANYRTSVAVSKNLFCDLGQLEYLDLEKPYWNNGYNEAAVLCGGQYFLSGPICLTFYRFIFATFFNKNTFDDYQIPYLYEAVRNGTWTLDYQYEIADMMYEDLNGNGKSDEGDRFGFTTNYDNISVDPYWSSCELPILIRDDDGHFVISLKEERMTNAITKINHLFWDTDATYRVPKSGSDDEQTTLYRLFGESTAAMATLRLIGVESGSLRNMSELYGIVPIPKLEESQENYYSMLHDNTSCVGIPLTQQDEELEMTGAFMEALASESYKTLLPAYYEQALKTKYVRDEESVEMLDTVVNGVIMDPAMVYCNVLATFHVKMRNWAANHTNAITSSLKTTVKVLEKAVDKLNEDGDKLKDLNAR